MAESGALKPHWFYILLTLSEGERHGLAIAREVESLSDGRIRLWPATLYGSLDDLRRRRWIEEINDPRERPEAESERKRYYRLTRSGRQIAQLGSGPPRPGLTAGAESAEAPLGRDG